METVTLNWLLGICASLGAAEAFIALLKHPYIFDANLWHISAVISTNIY